MNNASSEIAYLVSIYFHYCSKSTDLLRSAQVPHSFKNVAGNF